MHYLHECQDRGTDRWVLKKTGGSWIERKIKCSLNFARPPVLFAPPPLGERELAYLNEATDRIDLEYRQRAVDRGMFRNAGF